MMNLSNILLKEGKGVYLRDDATASQMIEVMNLIPNLSENTHPLEYAISSRRIDYNEYLELFSRVVLSDLWILVKPESEVPPASAGNEASVEGEVENQSPSDEVKLDTNTTENIVPEEAPVESAPLHSILYDRLKLWIAL